MSALQRDIDLNGSQSRPLYKEEEKDSSLHDVVMQEERKPDYSASDDLPHPTSETLGVEDKALGHEDWVGILKQSVPSSDGDNPPLTSCPYWSGTEVDQEFEKKVLKETRHGRWHKAIQQENDDETVLSGLRKTFCQSRGSAPELSGKLVVSVGRYYGLIQRPDTAAEPVGASAAAFVMSRRVGHILAATVEYRLRLVIQEALRFTRHSVVSRRRGSAITLASVFSALQLLKIRPVGPKSKIAAHLSYGPILMSSTYGTPEFLPSRTVAANACDDAAASVVRCFPTGTERCGVTEAEDPMKNADSVVDTRAYAEGEGLESGRSDGLYSELLPTLTLHWIAVNGRLVDSKWNQEAFQPLETWFSRNNKEGNTFSFPEHNSSSCDFSDSSFPPYHVSLRPLQGFDKGPSTNENDRYTHHKRSSSAQHNRPYPLFKGHQEILNLGVIAQRDKVYHYLSREHLLLLHQLRLTLRRPFVSQEDENSTAVLEALNSIRTSPGLRRLVPYLVHFMCHQIYAVLSSSATVNSATAAGVRTLLSGLLALCYNRNLQLELYVHQILQAMQSIVLYPFLGCQGLTVTESTALRSVAAEAVASLVFYFTSLHGTRVGALLARVAAAVYAKALSSVEQPLPTLLGAVLGLRYLGQSAVQSVVLPLLPTLAELLSIGFDPTATAADTDDADLQAPTPVSELEGENASPRTARFPATAEEDPGGFKVSATTVDQFKTALVQELLGALADSLGYRGSREKGAADMCAELSLPSIGSECLDDLKCACEKLCALLGDVPIPFILGGLERDITNPWTPTRPPVASTPTGLSPFTTLL